ncbi:MAG TPA: hypothetical protein DC022_11320 [Alcanivorax sp.]|jgi:hypothetical protein|nr:MULTISPECIES: hypothetical protein [Alcanivorax]MAC14359.1 hypothetical protein [Alcanivorax sp.]MBG31624.1 hypothetical protein [Alcanivorax sp.]MBG32119.1 hypothetical protein [Alcanivorax sp.]MBP21730.1 hypothetical protein [Alcanivorax sp.]MDF1636126.1 hypothetical protein [Alcanivorax jadensis]|tara:strand:- start:448 stop:732 length:285 start_codon:yes stop_codon:yes gene_type:complete
MMLEGNPGWMSDFLEEMGLPASAAFQGYVLYHRESDSFVADAPDPSFPHYVKPCAWAHRYPYIMLARDAAMDMEDGMQVQVLFRLGGQFLAYPI